MLRWARKHPELVILAAFIIAVTAAIIRYQTGRSTNTADAPPASPSPAAVQDSTPPASPQAPDTQPSPAPSVIISDLPTWDQAGDPTCQMHYYQRDGQVVTVFTLTKDGELITHVSASNLPTGFIRHDEQLTRGASAFVYPTTLAQVGDMGAIFQPTTGGSVVCGIAPGNTAP